MVEHFYVKSGGPDCGGFWDEVQAENREKDRQTPGWKPYPATAVGVGN